MSISRFLVLFEKECRQLFRDPFNIVFGIALPIVLLVVMGYGLSFDVRDIRVAFVAPEQTALSQSIAAKLRGSAYFSPEFVRTAAEASELVRADKADAALFLPQNFEKNFAAGTAEILIVTNASNPQQARLKENYLRSVVAEAIAENAQKFAPAAAGTAQISAGTRAAGTAQIVSRMWFNETGESLFFLVPGLIAIILTLIGAMLTSMLMAQEYECGNLESMFVTPMRSIEILLAKAAVNFFIGLAGTLITLLASTLIFSVPIRGSFGVLLLGCALYLILSLAVGLLISSLTKSRFVAMEITIVVTLMPSILLSGYIYEIGDLPVAIQVISTFVPARYLIDFLQTVMLAGNYWPQILADIAVIALFTVAFIAAAILKNPKRLED